MQKGWNNCLTHNLFRRSMPLYIQIKPRERLMPIREYRCIKCGQVNELLVGIGRNSDELVCSSCGSKDLEGLMSAASFAIKNASVPSVGSTCCGGVPSEKGCVPGSCCGQER